MPSLTEVILSLTKFICQPKQYVDLTAARVSGSAKGLEYDIIIIGGGMLLVPFSLNVIKSLNVGALVRNGWLCACVSSFREPEYSRALT